MCVLAKSDVQELLLGPSLQDHNGLNIGLPDLFRGVYINVSFLYFFMFTFGILTDRVA